MPIPRHLETEEDRKREELARQKVGAYLGEEFEVMECGQFSHHDWEIWREGQIDYLGEYKYRNCISTEFDAPGGIIFSLKRYYRLKNSGIAHNCPVLVFFEFTDGIFSITLSNMEPSKGRVIKRNIQREGSTNETEEVLLIPSSALTRIEE